MPYKYVAYTAERKVVEGVIDVSTEELAEEALGQSGYKIISLKLAQPRFNFRRSFPLIFGVKSRDVIAFSRQLATLIERGVNSFTALKMLRDQIRSVLFREVVTTVIQDVEQGSSFSNAINKHPYAFPPIYGRIIEVGEKTGNLEVVLRQVADYIEKEKAALARVSKAMIYPAFILLVACAVVVILTMFTLPPLLDMFDEFETELPLITKLFTGFIGFLTDYKFLLMGIVIGVAILLVYYVRTASGREKFDRLLLKLPLIGYVVNLREMSHLSRTMAVSLDAGLPMTDAMDLAVQTTENRAVRKAVEDVQTQVIQGRGLFGSMASDPLFPSLLVQMARVGEEVGTLSTDLSATADLYEREVDERVDTLISMLQPCLLLIIGFIVAFIVISVVLPIYTIMGSI